MAAPVSSNFCAAAQLALVQTAGMIGPESYEQFVEQDAFGEVVERDEYNLSLGEGQKYTTIGRFDARDVQFTSRTITDPTANPTTSRCEPNAQSVFLNALRTKTVDIVDAELISPTLCLDDLRDTVNGSDTLRSWVSGLKDKTQYTMSRFNQIGIATGAGQKVIAKSNGQHVYATDPTVTGLTYPASQADGPASINLLTQVQQQLIYAGAGKYAYKKESNRPIFLAFLSSEALESITHSDPRFREDLRHGQSGMDRDSALLGPVGSVDILRSTAFMVIERPRRFTYSGGTYTEVPPYITGGNPTIGTEIVPNPAYQSLTGAPYEEILLPNKMSYRMLVPDSDLRLPNGISYPTQKYMGEWQFKVPDLMPCPVFSGGNVVDIKWGNIRGNQGFFYAYFLLGRKFPFPQYSASIIVSRCGFQQSNLSCVGS